MPGLPPETAAALIALLIVIVGFFLRKQISDLEKANKELKDTIAGKGTSIDDLQKLVTDVRIVQERHEGRIKACEQDVSNAVSYDVFDERSAHIIQEVKQVGKDVKNLDQRKVSYGEMPAAKPIPRVDPPSDPPEVPPPRRALPSSSGHRR